MPNFIKRLFGIPELEEIRRKERERRREMRQLRQELFLLEREIMNRERAKELYKKRLKFRSSMCGY